MPLCPWVRQHISIRSMFMAGLQHTLRVTALNATPAAYGPILRLQELLWAQRKEGLISDTLLQLEVRPALHRR